MTDETMIKTFTIRARHHLHIWQDLGVQYKSGESLISVEKDPAAGQYACTNDGYQFSPADEGKIMVVDCAIIGQRHTANSKPH